METIITCPGLSHIAKKIIRYWNNEQMLDNIKSLRLVCKLWNAFLSSQEMCQLWQEIYHKRLLLDQEILNLLDNFYDQANQQEDRKQKNSMTLMKPTTIEIVLCHGSPDLLALVPKTFQVDINRLLFFAMYNFCQKDIVKHLLRYNFELYEAIMDTLIMQLSWRIINCQFNFPHLQTLKENLSKVLSVFTELFPNVIAKCISEIDHKYVKTKFETRTNMDLNGNCGNPCQLVPKALVNLCGFNNPFLLALHHDIDHQLSEMINDKSLSNSFETSKVPRKN